MSQRKPRKNNVARNHLSGGFRQKRDRRRFIVGERKMEWFEDNNLHIHGGIPPDFFERFISPGLAEWPNSRQAMDVFMIRSATWDQYISQKPSAVIENIARVLNAAGIKVALDDVSATMIQCCYANPDYSSAIARIQSMLDYGFDVRYLSLQSILSKHFDPLNCVTELEDYTMAMRIEDAAGYAAQVLDEFPSMQFGIIDAVPTHNDDYESAYSGLVTALDTIDKTLDFIILDCPFSKAIDEINGNSWAKIKAVRDYVRGLDASFGLICTDSAGMTSAADFRAVTLQGLSAYLAAGGDADIYLFSSWYTYPVYSIPDIVTAPTDPTMLSVFLEVCGLL